MKLPFSKDQFLAVFASYNQAIYPLQWLFYAMAASIIFIVLKQPNKNGTWVSLLLSFLWMWMGVVYHIGFFTEINKAAYFFGVLFIIQGLLFLYFGVIRKHISFSFNNNLAGWSGFLCIVYALLLYPLAGYIAGHKFPAAPGFGLPCPTTIFTIGILIWTTKPFPRILPAIPLVWGVIGTSAAFSLGITEDYGLLFSALLYIVLMFSRQLHTRSESVSDTNLK